MFEFLKESKNTFEGSLPDEKTLEVLHEHWFNVASKFGVILVLVILPFVLHGFVSDYLTSSGLSLLYWLIVVIYIMFLWFRLFYVIMKYLMNIWIITNHRIIDMELHGFFNRSVSEINLAKIQDVSVHIKGFYQTLMNFGDIEVQSAGEQNKFILHSMPNPNKTKELIMRASADFDTFHPSLEPTL